MEAGYILRTFAHYVKDGLIPNMFPEGETKAYIIRPMPRCGFSMRIEKYVAATGIATRSAAIAPKLIDIVDRHVRGTRFGIGVDPDRRIAASGRRKLSADMDGREGGRLGRHAAPRESRRNQCALVQRAPPVGKLGPRGTRRNARRCSYSELANRVYESFNKRFWYEAGNYLYDVVDGEAGDDMSLRPNQLFAFSLSYPVLNPTRWKPVLDVVQHHLLTPVD